MFNTAYKHFFTVFFIIVEAFLTSLRIFVGPVHFMNFNLLPIALFKLMLFGIALE